MARAKARDEMVQAEEGIILDGNPPPPHCILVKRRIAEETGHEIGLDTATRYLMR
jgi:hypothetical protein